MPDTTLRRYGSWSGNSKGQIEDTARCIEAVHDKFWTRQCQKPRGHGPDGLYCKQHDPITIAAKDKAKREAYEAEWDKRELNTKITKARLSISETARKVFRQEATLDELEREVTALESLLATT